MACSSADVDGITVGEALNASATPAPRKVGGRPVGAYFEAHIEQGPILEDEHKTIGVVMGALGLRWYDVVIAGQDAHAGPTPMRLRKDALLVGAARIVGAVNRDRPRPSARTAAGRSVSCKSSPTRATSFRAKCACRWTCGTRRPASSTRMDAGVRDRRAIAWRRPSMA